MTEWQKLEMEKKALAQQEIQNALRKQIMERDAEKARIEAVRKEEERKEHERTIREQEELRKMYASEVIEAQRKEACMATYAEFKELNKIENERIIAERAAKAKREAAAFEAHSSEPPRQRQQSNRKNSNPTPIPQDNPPYRRSASPPIPTHQRKASPPIPTHRVKTDEVQPPRSSAGTPNGFKGPTPEPTLQSRRAPSQQETGRREESRREHQPEANGRENSRREEARREESRREESRREEKKAEMETDTRAVLDQLLQIQHELEEEDRKVQQELATKTNEKKELKNAYEILKERSRTPQFNDVLEHQKTSIYPVPILDQQKVLLEKQRREISALRRGRGPALEPEVQEANVDSKDPDENGAIPLLKDFIHQQGAFRDKQKDLPEFLKDKPFAPNFPRTTRVSDLLPNDIIKPYVPSTRPKKSRSALPSDSKLVYVEKSGAAHASSRGLMLESGGSSSASSPEPHRRHGRRRPHSSTTMGSDAESASASCASSFLDITSVERLNDQRLKKLMQLEEEPKKLADEDLFAAFLKRQR
ncbi:hypothetical protein HK101_003235 [Irineochytrium annulatum]|nr:hypothetical protein HK101_003235 [Irineochytrium annulatum]